MRDFTDDLKALRARVDEAHRYLRIDELTARRPELETEAARPDLWDDPDRARRVTGELASITQDVELYADLVGAVDEAETLQEMAAEEGDDSLEDEIAEAIAALARRLDALELRSLFTGEYDERDAIAKVNSGEGGTDAADWAEMLLRMYLRWAEQRGFAVEVLAVTAGQEAGISSAEFEVRGRHAYGLLRSEHGVHRLVRMSPFNAQGKRQTAFAALEVVPAFDESDDDAIDVDKDDIRVDTYRSSGAGGQHVNVTDSAIRITHLPTGIVVSCQNERSQHQNRERAMTMLRARLAEVRRQERQAELDEIRGDQQRVGFGSQIRSYVLHPYQQVKDLRTDHETGNVDGVLSGALDPFIEAYLRWQRAGGAEDGGAPAVG